MITLSRVRLLCLYVLAVCAYGQIVLDPLLPLPQLNGGVFTGDSLAQVNANSVISNSNFAKLNNGLGTGFASLTLTNVFTGRQNATGAASTAPVKIGTSLPVSCTSGDMFLLTNSAPGASIYACIASTWVPQAGGVGVTSFNTRNGVVTLLSADVAAVEQDLRPTAKPQFVALTLGGEMPDTNGIITLNGITSGKVSFSVADIAGTAIVYVLPSTAGTAGQVLSDSGVITCPTLPSGSPTLCHGMVWITPSAGSSGPFVSTSSFSGSITNAIASLTGGVGTVIANQSVTISSTVTIPTNVTVQCIPGVIITQSNSSLDVFAVAAASTGNTLEGCTLSGGKDGIAGFNLNGFTARGNTITGFHQKGIVLGKPTINTVLDSNIIKSGFSGCIDGIFSEDPGSNLSITRNNVDTTNCTDHGIAVHTFSSGGTASQLIVADNTVTNHGTNFSYEIEQNSPGGTINGCTIARNKSIQAAAGNGGISVVGSVNCNIQDNDINLGGFSPAIDGLEIANSTNPIATGNQVYGGAANSNALAIDSTNGAVVTGNILGGYVFIVNSGTFSGVTTLSNNNLSDNVIQLPVSSTMTKTTWLQCNVASGVCNNNKINNNTITGVSVGSSYGIYLEADGHTVDGTQVVNNKTSAVTTSVSQDGGVTNTFNPPQASHGVGTSIQTFSGSFATNDCAKLDSNGTLVSAGAACGTPSGGVTSFNTRTGAVSLLSADVSAVEQDLRTSASPTFVSVIAGGVTPTASGIVEVDGLTSGGTALVSADVGGTRIAYVLPTTNGTAGQVLGDSGSTSCPTLPGGSPSTCHLLAWVDNPVVPLTSGTSITLSGNNRNFVCTGTCTITVPVPSAGIQYCVANGNNVSTVITLAAIGSSARYENTARTAYGTAGTGTFVSGGAVGDRVCITGLDSTHYLTFISTGTWAAN